jgi:hypothetical protein
MTNLWTLFEDIENGNLDNNLDEISAAIKKRQTAKRTTRTKGDFGIGQRVRFNSMCGTKYLVGSTGTVVGMRRTKIVVTLDKPMGRFSRITSDGTVISPEIVVPVSIVDPE